MRTDVLEDLAALRNQGRSSTLMIEATGSSVRSVNVYWTIWHDIPENSNLHVQIFSFLHFSHPHYTSVTAKMANLFFLYGTFM